MEDSEVIARIVSRLQERVPAYRISYQGDSIWIGDWEALMEARATLRGYRTLEKDPVSIAVGLLLDALLERDPGACRIPRWEENSPFVVDASRERD